MKDVNFNNIKPVAEPRSTDKPARKEPARQERFDAALEKARSELDQVATGDPVNARDNARNMDAKAIKDQLDAATEDFHRMMRVEQSLRQAHRMITQKQED